MAEVPLNFTVVAPVKLVPSNGNRCTTNRRAGTRADAGNRRRRHIGERPPVPVPVPPGVVTATSTAPAESAGVVAVIEVALTTVTTGRRRAAERH